MNWPFDDVYLARHGRTEWNLVGRRQGQLDSPLTAEGVADAQAIARQLEPGQVDRVFTSPQGRALTTAELIGASLELAPIVLDGLAEVHHGTFAGLTRAEIERRHPGELARREARKYQWRFPGGESYEDADRRAAGVVAEIAAIGARRPLIVTHEMIARMLLRRLGGLASDEALRLTLPHGLVCRASRPGAQRSRR